MIRNIERRLLKSSKINLRAGDDKAKSGIEGYSAVFNEQYDSGWFIETIKPGTFSRAISEKQDVRCLFNHDANNLLGRTKSKTLTLTQDKSGLHFACDLNMETRIGAEVHAMIDRGDLDGCSFGFIVTKQTWRDEKDDDGNMIHYRDIEDVDLLDVGPVTYPAFEGTSVDTRSLWPNGVPAEVRSHVPALSKAEKRDKKTKRVAGKDLPSSKFAYVGDVNDTSTWKLPIHDAAHVRNALARFDQTEGIPQDEKDKVWNKIVAAAKKFGVKVADKKSREEIALEFRAVDPDGDGDDDQELIDSIENVAADASDFAMCAAAALSEITNGDTEDGPSALQEALDEANELKGLLDEFIEQAEQELSEGDEEHEESEDDGDEAQRMRDRVRLAHASL
jgi:hypothetical protein